MSTILNIFGMYYLLPSIESFCMIFSILWYVLWLEFECPSAATENTIPGIGSSTKGSSPKYA